MESMEDFKEELENSYNSIETGDIVKGIIISVNDQEAIVDTGKYEQAVLPAREVSYDPNITLRDLEEGKEYDFLVLEGQDERGRSLLSKKQADDMVAWKELEEAFNSGSTLTVKIQEAVKGGVTTFINGVRGFIPASQLSLSFVKDLSEFAGKEVDARIITFQPDKKKLVLSSRIIQEENKAKETEDLLNSIAPGSVFSGKVETIRPFGAFVRLDNGLSGLVHISQISHRHLKDPSEVLKEGDTVNVKVTGIKDQKISLSIKALQDAEDYVPEDQKGPKEFKDKGDISTSLGDLLKDFKLV